MKFQVLCISALSLFFISFLACKSKENKEEQKDYLDVSSYLRGQLRYLDTVPFAFLKLTKKDSVFTDSQYIPKEEVKKIAERFLTDEIKKGSFEKKYTETTIADETLGLLTLTYSANSGNISVSRVDVYVNPEKERISQLYIVRNDSKGDSSVRQQLLWRHNKSFTLITVITKKDQQEKITTEKVVWDERED